MIPRGVHVEPPSWCQIALAKGIKYTADRVYLKWLLVYDIIIAAKKRDNIQADTAKAPELRPPGLSSLFRRQSIR